MTSFNALRRGAGLKLDQVAHDFSVSIAEVASWESGQAKAPTRILNTLEILLDFASAEPVSPPITPRKKAPISRSGSFTDNMRLPLHRWFRYSAGFSAQWVEDLVETRRAEGRTDFVLDPFVGSGTTLLASQDRGVDSIGLETHPFVRRIATAKLGWNVDVDALRARGERLMQHARAISAQPCENELLRRCYEPDNLDQLQRMRAAYVALEVTEDDSISNLLWLALTAILRESSRVGTAQWQYLLPNKTKGRVAEAFNAFQNRIELFAQDIDTVKAVSGSANAALIPGDARNANTLANHKGAFSLVVTSPPYPNNFDYADTTRLEMTFWNEVTSWSGLHAAVRRHLICSCSQHSAAERLDLDELLADPILDPVRPEIETVCRQLSIIRLERGGKKTYHTMIAAYFIDLANVWKTLRYGCASGADLVLVVGDSAPYGVHVPVDTWLIALAEAAGFSEPRFEQLRERNLKWENRKHRVPLKEGRLWLRG